MVLGLKYGQTDKDDLISRQRANAVNDEMMKKFAEKGGSYICNELLGCDIRTPEGVQYARDNKLFTDFCPKMVANAVDILEEICKNESGGKNRESNYEGKREKEKRKTVLCRIYEKFMVCHEACGCDMPELHRAYRHNVAHRTK